MSGGLAQLITRGAEGIYLTNDPDHSIWKNVYKRSTLFARECIENSFNEKASWGRTSTCNILKRGDLLSKIHLQVSLPSLVHGVHTEQQTITHTNGTATTVWVNSVGHRLIEQVDLIIGGEIIDTQYGLWMDIWSELTETKSIDNLIYKNNYTALRGKSSGLLIIPLNFWFCRNPGSAIPLLAMENSQVKLKFKFASFANCIQLVDSVSGIPITGSSCKVKSEPSINIRLYSDYVYLGKEESNAAVASESEYLIEQVQHCEILNLKNVTIKKLPFIRPVKEIIWVLRRSDNINKNSNDISMNDFFNFSSLPVGGTGISTDLLKDTVGSQNKFVFNNTDHARAGNRPASYYRLIQPYYRHSRVPDKNIYCYNFGLYPENYQPSGTINLSRIDNCKISLDLIDTSSLARSTDYSDIYAATLPATEEIIINADIFATSYNIFKIQHGIGGIVYKR